MPWVRTSLRCPHCGGQTSARAARCAHCNERLKTGTASAASLGVGPGRGREQPVRCPECHERTDFAYLSTIQSDVCSVCGGVWFDREELADLPARLSDGELVRGAAEALSAIGHGSGKPRAAGYLDCPLCASPLIRRVYRGASGVMTDCCDRCGTWVAGGSMSRILEIIASGKLPEIEHRAAEKRQAEAARRERDAQAGASLPTMLPQVEDVAPSYLLRDIADGVDIVMFLLRLLG